MKHLRFFILSVIIIVSGLEVARSLSRSPAYHQAMNIISPNDYARYWKKVDSLQQKALPQSALKMVNTIYEKAKAENQPDQLVKAVIHWLKLTSYTEEDAFVLSLIDLKKEAIKASFPARPILHSMLAEMYWAYYQQNRYRFLQQTATQWKPMTCVPGICERWWNR